MTDNLNRAVKSGVAWTVVERGALQFLNLLTSVILARLLSPSDFGIIGLALLFTGLATRLVKFGFGMALVQRESIRPDHISTLFVMTLIINGLIFLALVTVSPYVGTYFNNPLVGSVLAVMSANFLIRCIGICPSALLRRKMNFKAMTVGSLLDYSVKLVLAVVLAIEGFGVWSLAYGELAGALAEKIYLVIASGWRPSLRVTRAAVQDLFGFGMGVSLKSTLIYLAEQADNFVIGKWLGTTSLGFYAKAYNLMDLPVKELSSRITVVLFPAYARIYQDSGRLRAAFRKTILSLSLFSYPVFGSLMVLAPQVILVVYGSQWVSSIVPFQILCLAGLPRVLTQVASSVINATGSVGPEVQRRGAVLVLLVAGCLIGSLWGIIGVAAAVALVNLITVILILLLLIRICPITLGDVFKPQGIPLVAMVVLLGVEKGCQFWTGQMMGLHIFWVLAVSLAAGCLAYLGVIYWLRNDPLKALLEELRGDLWFLVGRISLAVAKRPHV